MVHFFPDARAFALRLARASGFDSALVRVHLFPDGESLPRVQAPAPPHAVLVRSLDAPNAKIVETLLAADALRRAGARRLTLVAPYLPYMRQDEVFAAGEPVSQRVIGGLLGERFDRVIAIEPHLHRVRRLGDVVPGRARAISAAPAVAAHLSGARGCLLAGPDEESAPWIRAIARSAGLPWVVGRKTRASDRSVRIAFPDLAGGVTRACPRAVIVDDVASSAPPAAARALRKAGADGRRHRGARDSAGALARCTRRDPARDLDDTIPMPRTRSRRR
jgi:ribose-phosphate pyrophosphokinase